MKMTIVVLVVLGLVAAMCAVLLVNLWPLFFGEEKVATKEISVLVATRSIPAHSDLTQDDFTEEIIDIAQETGHYRNANEYFKDGIYLVGKTVSSNIATGQPIMRNMIITDPDIATMLKALKPGMRAVSVKLSGDQISGGLLYPGCFVDVLAQFTTRGNSGNSEGEAVSKIFLERVKVIAVKGELTANDGQDANGKTSGVKTSTRSGLTVTLVVATEQVESLQLATERGTVALTLRNPLDDIMVNSKGTVLDPGKISVFSEFFAPSPNKDQISGSDDENGMESSKHKIEVIKGSKTSQEVVMPLQ